MQHYFYTSQISGQQAEARQQILQHRQTRPRGRMEVPGHRRDPRGQEEGQERGPLPDQDEDRGHQEGSDGRPQGRPADCPSPSCH
jgi:hypothetical protein